MSEKTNPKTIDEYSSQFSEETKSIIENIRQTIIEVAPNATEKIVYGLPTFVLNGNLVHYGAFKKHIGFYPDPSGILAFKDQLSDYENAKGSVKFPLNQPIPYELIRAITAFRVTEQLAK